MIFLSRISKYEWLVQYQGQLKRVKTPILFRRKGRLDSLMIMRFAIFKATRLNKRQIRFVDNVRLYGAWVTQWIELGDNR